MTYDGLPARTTPAIEAATTRGTLFAGTGFIDGAWASFPLLSIQRLDGGGGALLGVHANEGETGSSPRDLIHHDRASKRGNAIIAFGDFGETHFEGDPFAGSLCLVVALCCGEAKPLVRFNLGFGGFAFLVVETAASAAGAEVELSSGISLLRR